MIPHQSAQHQSQAGEDQGGFRSSGQRPHDEVLMFGGTLIVVRLLEFPGDFGGIAHTKSFGGLHAGL